MVSSRLAGVRGLLAECSPEEQATIFSELRQRFQIHEFEQVIGAPAEMILEAVHRAPELTRRMLRGVIADAAFRAFVVPAVTTCGWQDTTPIGNFAYDYKMSDTIGDVTIQVKLQRSEKGAPVIKRGARFGFNDDVFIVETQKTRSGADGFEKTRPYRYEEFDIIAVSMQPSTGRWDRFMYAPSRWLLAGNNDVEMATLQPVSMNSSAYWTEDFITAVERFRTNDVGNRLTIVRGRKKQRPAPREG